MVMNNGIVSLLFLSVNNYPKPGSTNHEPVAQDSAGSDQLHPDSDNWS
jgi:hypothetical protein